MNVFGTRDYSGCLPLQKTPASSITSMFRFLFLLIAPIWGRAPDAVTRTIGEAIHVQNTSVVLKVADGNPKFLSQSRAVLLLDGRVFHHVRLKRGKFNDDCFDMEKCGERFGGTHVRLAKLARLPSINADYYVAIYEWEWVGGSSSQEGVVQVLRRSEQRLEIVQQIDYDGHGPSGATYKENLSRLIVKSVAYAANEGRCCPSLQDVATFQWKDHRFALAGYRQLKINPAIYRMK